MYFLVFLKEVKVQKNSMVSKICVLVVVVFCFCFFFNFYLKSPTAIVTDKRKCKADMCLRKYIRLISYFS